MNMGISKMMMILMKIKKIFIRLVKLIIRYICCNKKTESMKLQLYKNIDLVQINIKEGVREYFFPTNVDWADQKIDKMIIYGSNPESGEVSPIDGISYVADREQIGSLYLDLYAEDDTQIAYNMSALDILHTNNHPLEINSKISLTTSKLVFTEDPVIDGCVLMYVFWGTKTVESELPANSVTVKFDATVGKELPLSKVIDTYIHAQSKKLKGLYFWGGVGASGVYLTLRDRNYRTIAKLLPGAFLRPQMGVDPLAVTWDYPERVQTVQVAPFLLDDADIDFDNSFLYVSVDSPGAQVTHTITFLY